MDSGTVCSVALPIPSPEPYSYLVPVGLADRIAPGSRVVVPVRSREMVGVVTAVQTSGTGGLKSVLLAPDVAPLLSAELLTLAAWISGYYASPIGLTLKSMLPGALWGASRTVATVVDPSMAPGGVSRSVVSLLQQRGGRATAAWLRKSLRRSVWEPLQRLERVGAVTIDVEPPTLGPKAAQERTVRLVQRLPSLQAREQCFGRAARQRTAFDLIDDLGGEVSLPRLLGEFGFSRAVVQALVQKGVAVMESRERMRDPFADVAAVQPVTPTVDQTKALEAIAALPAGRAVTLFGVTGSGKTLVYLQAIRALIESGGGAIVLVPEIALTPQTIARVRGVFGDAVAVLHSGLSDGERADAWRGLAAGKRRVAVGARSAIFAPVRQLAAIVVDEEHDASYKSGDQPRYHARDVALRRGRIEGARVLLGSATPSLETWHAQPRIPVIRLPNRVTANPLPRVELIDIRSAPRTPEAGALPWSTRLDDAVRQRLDGREQVILLLNRRGFAHFLQCATCGDVPHCSSCSIALTVHRSPPSLRCHYCDYRREIPSACDVCGGETHRTRGVGTQSLERWLTHRFPDARVARMDADTTSTKWSHGRILDEFADGQVDILFGTQMISKGLDFPGVTLVGVVHADTGLHLPDFRAAERTFQLIAQVAGRAGRGAKGGEVLVQTARPDHYALRAAAAHDFEAFAREELRARVEPAYPPHVSMVNVVVSGEGEPAVQRSAADLGDWLRGLVGQRGLDVDVLGPAPAPLARIKGRWRWHLVLRSAGRSLIGRLTRYASAKAPSIAAPNTRVTFDRDPVSLL
jgi:primosomal protein N' (replication factor Y) (superfamily II helicase)